MAASVAMLPSTTTQMHDERYSSSSWDYADNSTTDSPTTSQASHSHHHYFSRHPMSQGPSSDTTHPTPIPTIPVSPDGRSSIELNALASAPQPRWRDSMSNGRDTASTIAGDAMVEPSFDENVLRALCDMDCGVPLLLDRIKQSMVSCREASAFFKKRATIEEEYGRSLQKLSKMTSEVYGMNDGKAGTFVAAWQTAMKLHDTMAENRLRFSQRLNEMSEDLSTLVKEVDKNRKQTKELATRFERTLQEAVTAVDKSKARFDMTAEELERVLVQKEGECMKETAMQARSPGGVTGKRALGKAVAKGGMLLKGKNPGNIQRQEDDVRARMSNASDIYKKAVTDATTIRQEYFNFQLPRVLRALKECADEIDLGTQYHLTRYAYLFETIVLSDGSTLAPTAVEDGQGLKATIESIDNRSDFKVYMQNYAYAHGGQPSRGPKREGPWEEGFVAPLPSYIDRVQSNNNHQANVIAVSNSGHTTNSQGSDKMRPTFGVDLAEQMIRDGVEIPPIMEKCCAAIEKYGLTSQGIYRLSGMMTKIQRLKERLDRDIDDVDLDTEEWTSDINNVTSVLKLWLRELPDPLMTSNLHQGFIDAAKIENDRLRHIRLHEQVNGLPDPNYATLKYFMGHLYKIAEHEAQNAMSIQNLAIVFGPTLFRQPFQSNQPAGQTNGVPAMADAAHQNKAIETILEHYKDIFIDENEEA